MDIKEKIRYIKAYRTLLECSYDFNFKNGVWVHEWEMAHFYGSITIVFLKDNYKLIFKERHYTTGGGTRDLNSHVTSTVGQPLNEFIDYVRPLLRKIAENKAYEKQNTKH